MTRSKFFYIILGIHVLCGILGLIILSFIDIYDRIRWSIGDMLRLLFFLTPFVLIFCVPKKMPTWSKVCMRIYCGVYILPFVIFPPLWWMMFNFDHVIAENEQYIIRFYKDGLRDYYEQKMNKENHEDGEPIITLGTLLDDYTNEIHGAW